MTSRGVGADGVSADEGGGRSEDGAEGTGEVCIRFLNATGTTPLSNPADTGTVGFDDDEDDDGDDGDDGDDDDDDDDDDVPSSSSFSLISF